MFLDNSERNEYGEQEDVQADQREEENLLGFGFHLRHVVRREEERDVGRDKDGYNAPPLIDPNERTVFGTGKEGLDKGEQ